MSETINGRKPGNGHEDGAVFAQLQAEKWSPSGPTKEGRELQKLELFRDLPPAAPYPLQALGSLRAAAEEVHRETRAAIEICAQSVLGVTALAVQPHFNVVLPWGQQAPLSLYLGTISGPSNRKTSADLKALKAVTDKEAELISLYEAETRAHENDIAFWETESSKLKGQYKKTKSVVDQEMFRRQLHDLGGKPKPPRLKLLTVADPTMQALILYLRDGLPYVGLFTTEGGLFIGGHSLSAEQVMHATAQLNQLWGGEAIKRLRVLTGNAVLLNRRFSMHSMYQPFVAVRLLSNPALEGIGFTSRQPMVYPPSLIGSPTWASTHDMHEQPAILEEFHVQIRVLLDLEPRFVDGTDDQLNPRPLSFSPSAAAKLMRANDLINADLAKHGRLHPIQSFGAKFAEHASRFAGLETVHKEIDPGEINIEHMENGVESTRYYCDEAMRLRGGIAADNNLLLANDTLEWWKRQSNPKQKLRDIYRNGPAKLRSVRIAKDIVNLLETHEQIIPVKGAKGTWELAP